MSGALSPVDYSQMDLVHATRVAAVQQLFTDDHQETREANGIITEIQVSDAAVTRLRMRNDRKMHDLMERPNASDELKASYSRSMAKSSELQNACVDAQIALIASVKQ